jgi:hypothetical protein
MILSIEEKKDIYPTHPTTLFWTTHLCADGSLWAQFDYSRGPNVGFAMFAIGRYDVAIELMWGYVLPDEDFLPENEFWIDPTQRRILD